MVALEEILIKKVENLRSNKRLPLPNPVSCWDDCDCDYCTHLRLVWIIENKEALNWILGVWNAEN